MHKGLVSGSVIIQGPGQTGVKASYWAKGDADPAKAPNAIPVAGDWDSVKTAAARLRDLIDAAHVEATQQRMPSQTQPASSAADEIRKLAELRDAGAISDQEFQTAKQRLLADI